MLGGQVPRPGTPHASREIWKSVHFWKPRRTAPSLATPTCRPARRPARRPACLLLKCVQIVRDVQMGSGLGSPPPPTTHPRPCPTNKEKHVFSFLQPGSGRRSLVRQLGREAPWIWGSACTLLCMGVVVACRGVPENHEDTPTPRSLHTVVLSRQSERNHRGYLLRPIHAPTLALCNPLPKVVQPPPKQRFSP